MRPWIKSWLRVLGTGVAALLVVPLHAVEPPSRSELLDMVRRGQFDELEKLAGELRKEKLGFYNGWSKLSMIYDRLDGVGRNTDDSVWKNYIAKLEEWAGAYPQSPTPRVVLGKTYVSWAWKARGGGYADTVSEQGWRSMGERLKKARECLESAEQLPAKDPELYRALLSVALGQGWPKDEMDAAFEKGVALEPNYQQLYEAKAYFLLPRWYGAPGEWEAFALQAADTRGGDEGDILYMAIARSQAWSEGAAFFRNTRISYKRMQRGFEASLRRYPNYVWDMSSYCYFACIADDHASAKELFQKINDRWEKDVWGKQDYFQRWRDWALNNGPKPVAATRAYDRTVRTTWTADRIKSALLVATAIWLAVVLVIVIVVWLIGRYNRKSPPPLPPMTGQ